MLGGPHFLSEQLPQILSKGGLVEPEVPEAVGRADVVEAQEGLEVLRLPVSQVDRQLLIEGDVMVWGSLVWREVVSFCQRAIREKPEVPKEGSLD